MTDAQATALADHPPGDESIPGAPPLMSMTETAVYLKVPYNSLMQHWRKWGLASYKVGRERKFRQDQVDAWLLNQRESDVPPAKITA